MKPKHFAAIVFIVFGIGFLWMLRAYKLEAAAIRATGDGGADTGGGVLLP